MMETINTSLEPIFRNTANGWQWTVPAMDGFDDDFFETEEAAKKDYEEWRNPPLLSSEIDEEPAADFYY